MGENKYLGFGSIYKDAPQSPGHIEKDAFNSFCTPDDVQYDHSQHIKLTQLYSENYSIFKNERDKAQETQYNYYQYFDV